MSGEVVHLPARKFRKEIPAIHRQSLDTRLHWLWHQRFGTVQQIWNSSPDVLDHTACTLILQAIMAKDLDSITQLLHRLEGAPVEDQVLLELDEESMRL